jgi:hypothetical protein
MKEGSKSDRVDARKLAELLRAAMLRRCTTANMACGRPRAQGS